MYICTTKLEALERFDVVFLEEALLFLDGLDEKTRDKIIYNITKAKSTLDSELFKKLNADIWEFRTMFNRKHYRLFAFWDTSSSSRTIVIATHGIVKKANRTPVSEIEKAIKVRSDYLKHQI